MWQPQGPWVEVYEPLLQNGLRVNLISATLRDDALHQKFLHSLIGKEDIFQVCYLQYPHIPILHAVSTRIGGVSSGAYEGLNIGYTTEDEPDCVYENRERIRAACGIPVQPVLNMVHGTDMVYVDDTPDGRAIGDACMTDKRDLPMMITTADCVPIIIYDPDHHAASLVHAGWKGTLDRIAKLAVESMGRKFASVPSKLKIGLGPSIGPCCFEVGADVGEAFNRRFKNNKHLQELPLFSGITGNSQTGGKVDLWAANYAALLEAGAESGNICLSRVCSFCQSEMCYSYRRDNRVTGRMASLVVL